MELLLVAILIGLAPAFVARSKGRDFATWWVYGALLFIIALPHALLTNADARSVEQERLKSGDLKKCPFCAELIKQEARVCRYCGRDVFGASSRHVTAAGETEITEEMIARLTKRS